MLWKQTQEYRTASHVYEGRRETRQGNHWPIDPVVEHASRANCEKSIAQAVQNTARRLAILALWYVINGLCCPGGLGFPDCRNRGYPVAVDVLLPDGPAPLCGLGYKIGGLPVAVAYF